MNFKHLHIPRRGDYAPRLFRRDLQPGQGSGSTHSDAESPEEADLSYEDALLAAQLRHFLHSEYDDASPPPGSLGIVMQSAEMGVEPAELRRPVQVVAAPSLRTRAYESLSRLASGPITGRLASGFVALLVVLSILASNSSMLSHRGGSNAVRLDGTPETSQVVPAVGPSSTIAPAVAPTHQTSSGEYDRSAMISNDPPETQVPPRLVLEYFGPPAPDRIRPDRDQYVETLNKE